MTAFNSGKIPNRTCHQYFSLENFNAGSIRRSSIVIRNLFVKVRFPFWARKKPLQTFQSFFWFAISRIFLRRLLHAQSSDKVCPVISQSKLQCDVFGTPNDHSLLHSPFTKSCRCDKIQKKSFFSPFLIDRSHFSILSCFDKKGPFVRRSHSRTHKKFLRIFLICNCNCFKF